MFSSTTSNTHIQSHKLILDKVFRNKHQRQLAQDKKYHYFNVLSKIKSKFQNNKDIANELFSNNDRPKTSAKTMGISKSLYKVEKINKKMYRLQLKEGEGGSSRRNSMIIVEKGGEEGEMRRSYSRGIEKSNRVILKRRNTETEQLLEALPMPMANDNSIRPRLKELMRQHRNLEYEYKNKQMEKYVKIDNMEVWDEINGKLINLRRRSCQNKMFTHI